jgi:hypothetical protein
MLQPRQQHTQHEQDGHSQQQHHETLRARLYHLVFGIDGRALLHQQLDAWQMASSSSKVKRNTAVLHHTPHEVTKTRKTRRAGTRNEASRHTKINIT